MADPKIKYENLPGIAYDQPDVYECGDLPEVDQPEPLDDDDDNECIEQVHLSVRDSFGKFKGKHVGESVDFSDRLSRKLRTGYRVGEWALAASGDPETAQERYQRLRCEFAELVEQIALEQSKAKDDEKEEMSKLAMQIHSTKKVLEELKLDEESSVDPNAQQLQEILAQGKPASLSKGSASLVLKADARLGESARVARLEQRLHRLEAVAGVRDAALLTRLHQATGQATLCGAAAVLASRAALLRPEQVAQTESHLASLLGNMDAIKTAISPADPQKDTKINELYDMLKQLEGVSHSEILERLEALESLHNQASEFGKSLSELEALQATIGSGVENNETLLKVVQDVFADNINSIQKEIKKLEERVSKLKA